MTTAYTDTTYSIRVFTTEGRYACDTVTHHDHATAGRLYLGAITWMDTDPAAAIEEIQLCRGDEPLSITYAATPNVTPQNDLICQRAKADYFTALAAATERWSTAKPSLLSLLRALMAAGRTADAALDACINHYEAGYDTGYESQYDQETDRLNATYYTTAAEVDRIELAIWDALAPSDDFTRRLQFDRVLRIARTYS
jgi:hypothetical protein